MLDELLNANVCEAWVVLDMERRMILRCFMMISRIIMIQVTRYLPKKVASPGQPRPAEDLLACSLSSSSHVGGADWELFGDNCKAEMFSMDNIL